MTLTTVGIDFSLSCPALTIHEGEIWSPSNCRFFFLTSVRKYSINTEKVSSLLHQPFGSQEERLDWITATLFSEIYKGKLPIPRVHIEDYSYSSGSSSTHILAEGAGLLKWRLWKACIDCKPLPIGTIKKAATGKGNATKEQMCNAFLKEVGDLPELWSCRMGKSPLCDVADSYFISKLGFSHV